MKKRGREPNERTYAIMLRGFRLTSRQSGVKPVEAAYGIYKRLLSRDTEAIPNSYHHHAMIEVCGNHHDMDTLWNVIGDLPEAGDSKPNSQTFSLILIALRNCYDHEIESIPETQMELREEKRQNFLLDAKRIWADIINEWRTGELFLDNSLVSSMAAVLSDPLDELNSYNVLALFNQTMGVPILVPKPQASMKSSEQGKWEAGVRGSKDRPNYTPWRHLDSDVDTFGERHMEDKDTEDGKEELADNLENVFDPLDETKGPDPIPLLVPDNMTLNHILTVCRILTKGTAAGRGYWNLFTLDNEGYKIEPDEGNFHEYLRLLRISRSSHTAVDVINRQMVHTGLLEGKTFHIGMSCCLRDRTNPNVLLSAQALLNIMKDNLPLPDPRPLMSFVKLADALTENPQWLLGLRGLEEVDQNTTNLTMMGRNMRWALHKTVIASLEPHINKLYESMEQQLNSTRPVSTAPPPPDAVSGFIAVKLMVMVRELLDKLLGQQYKTVITKSDREWISPLAIKLRKFSKPEVATKLNSAHLRPLTHHYANDQTEST